MNATKFKAATDTFLNECDDGPYHDNAREVLLDFGKRFYPAIAKMCEREAALAKLTKGEIIMLGLDKLPAIADETPDEVQVLMEQIKRYKSKSPFSNSRDTALDGLLQMVADENNDI